MSDVLAVPERFAASAQYPRLRHARALVAILIDEDGGTSGLVTLGDLVESLVGDITSDVGALIPNNFRTADGSFTNDELRTSLEARELYDLKLEEDVEAETVDGHVFARVGRPAVLGDGIESADDHVLHAEDFDGLSVVRIRGLPSTGGSVLEEARQREH